MSTRRATSQFVEIRYAMWINAETTNQGPLRGIRHHFVHDVSTVHRCPSLWTPDGIVASRDSVNFWVHGAYPVSRCPRGQGVRAVSSLLGFERSFIVSIGNWGGPQVQQFATPPLDQGRGDSPSRADELARRREIHERKCKSGLRKRREIFLGYRHPSAHFTPSFAVFSWVPSAREAVWQAEAEAALTQFARPNGR